MDLNADLGEGSTTDRDLLALVTSASIACGSHAGDPLTMVQTARMAAGHGVSVGAHPSYPDREGFGRRPLSLHPDDLFATIVEQVVAMVSAATSAGTHVRFVKPHGALYNQAAAEPSVAEPVVRAAAELGLPLLCPHGSQMQRLASASGVGCYTEAFADRAYHPDGSLAPRGWPGAVLHDPAAVARQAIRLAVHGEVVASDGSVVPVMADSLCLHGDTPGAVHLARSVRRTLEDAGVALRSFLPG